MALRLITFDLDDTLWPVDPVLAHAEARYHEHLRERHPDIFEAVDQEALRAHRLQLLEQRPELQHDISRWRRDSLELLLRERGLDTASATNTAHEAFAVFLEARHSIELFEHVETVLASLSERFTLISLTNGNADVFRLDIGEHFHHGIRAEEVGASKPAPDMFLRALELGGCAPHEALHIGDDPRYDIAPARALGMHTLHAVVTDKHEQMDGKGFRSWEELPGLIKKLVEQTDA